MHTGLVFPAEPLFWNELNKQWSSFQRWVMASSLLPSHPLYANDAPSFHPGPLAKWRLPQMKWRSAGSLWEQGSWSAGTRRGAAGIKGAKVTKRTWKQDQAELVQELLLGWPRSPVNLSESSGLCVKAPGICPEMDQCKASCLKHKIDLCSCGKLLLALCAVQIITPLSLS